MAAPNELQALVKVSSEIEESDIKITYASQCIKGQEYISNKLQQEIQRREEQYQFLNNDNRKLETEIKHAEYEIKSLSASLEAIRSGNIEMKKELLLAKYSYVELVERVRESEKKYDDLWKQAKQRFESISFVQEWMEATKQTESLQSSLNILDNESKLLEKEIVKKKEFLLGEERKEIIKLAEFLVQREANLKTIKEKRDEVAKLSKEVEMMKAKQGFKSGAVPSISSPMANLDQKEAEDTNVGIIVDENWSNLSKNIYEGSFMMMPRLHLPSVDNDVLNVKLDLKKDSTLVTIARRSIEFCKSSNTQSKSDEALNDDYISCYFSKAKPVLEANKDGKQEKAEPYSKRKLINILDDMKLDDNETSNILSKVNPESLQEVDIIRSDSPYKENANDTVKSNRAKGPIESEVIEEIDLTRNSQNLLMPPSQFDDHELMNVEIRGRPGETGPVIICEMEHADDEGFKRNLIQPKEFQESSQGKFIVKKRVSFDIPMPAPVHEVSADIISEDNENEANVTITSGTSQAGSGAANDDHYDYAMIKEMLLKKHHLDLSPQFFYAKNNILKKKPDENVVKSKFFESNAKENEISATQEEGDVEMEVVDDTNGQNEEATNKITEVLQEEGDIVEMEEGNASGQNQRSVSPVENEQVPEKPLAGLLFAHGPQGFPDSLNVSISTTGYEGDGDFLHGLDSSLLLSPKADNAMDGNPAEGVSQQVPNFLAGFKKAGLSFFKHNPSVENPEPDAQKQENNFNFNFGSGEEKKNKGGLFSFFH